MTGDLIPLLPNCFSQDSKPGVSAKALYDFLELAPTQWTRWVKKNILTNPYAMEHDDWEGFRHDVENTTQRGLAGRPTQDYVVSIDLAKKLAMMARTEKGEEARQYFLDCERVAQGRLTPQVKNPAIDMEQVTALVQTVTVALVPPLIQAVTQAMTQAMAPLVQMLQTVVSSYTEPGLTEYKYITIEGWCRLRGIALPFSEKQTFGKRASVFCKEQGIRRGTVPDERYGKVGSYPMDVLDDLWRTDQDSRELWRDS